MDSPYDPHFIETVMKSNNFGKSMFSLDEAMDWLNKRSRRFYLYGESSGQDSMCEKTNIPNALNPNEAPICQVFENKEQTVYDDMLNAPREKIGGMVKAQVMEKFKNVLLENKNIILGLEILIRGIPIGDSLKQFNKMLEYLEYYSYFSMKKSMGDNVFEAFISKNIGLSVFGAILGPPLALGEVLVIYGDAYITPVATCIMELAYKAGVSDNLLRFVGANGKIETSYFEVRGLEAIKVARLKTPMIIFDDADIDSACEKVITGAWEHLGMLPESVGTLLVQETIFETVVNKLKKLVLKLPETSPDELTAQICKPIDEKIISNLEKNIKKAQNFGIEVFQARETTKGVFQPTMFIGAKVANEVLDEIIIEDASGNSLTVLSFRHLDEAIQLANNSKQGYGASVWSENLALCHEAAQKLNVGNVWINGHGESSAEITIVPRKSSGCGYIGGLEGFCMFYFTYEASPAIINPYASQFWSNTSMKSRKSCLQKFAHHIHSNLNKFRNGDVKSNDWIKNIPEIIYDCLSKDNLNVPNNKYGFYQVSTQREPLGLITIKKPTEDTHFVYMYLIVTAIMHGNTVCFITNDSDFPIYEEMSKHLPKGMLTIQKSKSPIPGPVKVTNSASDESYSGILKQVTCVKNIWSNCKYNF